jgi:hypothetical protein
MRKMMGKLIALVMAAAISAAFLYRDDPRVAGACDTAAYHAKGLAQQMKQDVGDLKKMATDLAPTGQPQKK